MQRLVPANKLISISCRSNLSRAASTQSVVASRQVQTEQSKQQNILPRQPISTKSHVQFNHNSNNKKSLLQLSESAFGFARIANKCFYSTGSLPPHTVIRLPALSPTMEAGTLASWQKQVGDHVAEGDLIAEIETDKATMGLEASDEGYLAKVFVEEKTRDILLKTPLCIVVEDEADVAAFADFKASDVPAANGPSATPASTPAAPATPAPATAANPPPLPPTPAAPTPAPSSPAPAQDSPAAKPATPGVRVFATPLARKLAAERGIDISLVSPSGPDNQIRAQDVANFVASTPAPAPATTQAVQADQSSSQQSFDDITLTNFRAVTAKRLLQSKQTIPHYYLTVDFEVDTALNIRRTLNEQLAKDNMKISLNDLVIKAAALACKKVPEANSHWMDTHIRQYNTVDINVAVATENGLITPIVFGADKKGLTSIGFDVNALAQKAKANKLQPHEFQGGTFTVSNLGMFGVKNFSAVINPPQSCILAVGGIAKQVVLNEEGGTRVASVMSVTLSCDHRVVDGAVGAKWLDHFKKLMENPAAMLL